MLKLLRKPEAPLLTADDVLAAAAEWTHAATDRVANRAQMEGADWRRAVRVADTLNGLSTKLAFQKVHYCPQRAGDILARAAALAEMLNPSPEAEPAPRQMAAEIPEGR